MAFTSGLFNSINGDRRYNAPWFASYFATFIGNGVFPNPSTGMQVIAGDGMQTVIKAGKAWINGYYAVNDDDYIMQHDIADGVLKRIDRIVLRLDFSLRELIPQLKKGTFASNPVAPTLQRDADAYEIALADVLINNGAINITQANITDLRLNTQLCGIVHGTVNQVDTTTIFNQYQAWFNEVASNVEGEIREWQAASEQQFMDWFDSLQVILDGDVAANLANKILNLEQTVESHVEDNVRHITSDERKQWNEGVTDYNFAVIDFSSDGRPIETQYKRSDNTLYLQVHASNPDIDGNFQTIVETYYDLDGVTVLKIITWTLTYNSDGVVTTRHWGES